ncbi:unnamed protein product, partial [Prorocentrum cordatum]
AVGSSSENAWSDAFHIFVIRGPWPPWDRTFSMAAASSGGAPRRMSDAGMGGDVGWGLKKSNRRGADQGSAAGGGARAAAKCRLGEEVLADAKQAAKGASNERIAQQLVTILGKPALSLAGDLRTAISVAFVAALAPVDLPRVEEDACIDAAQLGSPRHRARKDFARAFLAGAEGGPARGARSRYRKERVTKHDVKDMDLDIKYF